MRAKIIPVLEQAIENGLEEGWRRARKHVEQPSEGAIKQAQYDAIWLNISEAFDFDEVRTNDD